MFSWFLGPRTVDSAIAPLLKAQGALTAVFEERTVTISHNRNHIAELAADNVAAEAERDRALKIGDALSAITDPKE